MKLLCLIAFLVTWITYTKLRRFHKLERARCQKVHERAADFRRLCEVLRRQRILLRLRARKRRFIKYPASCSSIAIRWYTSQFLWALSSWLWTFSWPQMAISAFVSSTFQLPAIRIRLHNTQLDRKIFALLLFAAFYAQITVGPHVLMERDEIITLSNANSLSNSHSNHLCRWIDSIRFQFELAECEFRVDRINSN